MGEGRERDYKELAHMIMHAEKYQGLQSQNSKLEDPGEPMV